LSPNLSTYKLGPIHLQLCIYKLINSEKIVFNTIIIFILTLLCWEGNYQSVRTKWKFKNFKNSNYSIACLNELTTLKNNFSVIKDIFFFLFKFKVIYNLYIPNTDWHKLNHCFEYLSSSERQITYMHCSATAPNLCIKLAAEG
jgi:hypothetical protein